MDATFWLCCFARQTWLFAPHQPTHQAAPPLPQPHPIQIFKNSQIINVALEGQQPSMMDATEDMRAFHPALQKAGEPPAVCNCPGCGSGLSSVECICRSSPSPQHHSMRQPTNQPTRATRPPPDGRGAPEALPGAQEPGGRQLQHRPRVDLPPVAGPCDIGSGYLKQIGSQRRPLHLLSLLDCCGRLTSSSLHRSLLGRQHPRPSPHAPPHPPSPPPLTPPSPPPGVH
jgi:hypothetical protein